MMSVENTNNFPVFMTDVCAHIKKIVECAKNCPTDLISNETKESFYSLSADFEILLHLWQLRSNMEKNGVRAIDAELWEKDISLKYLFQEYIEEKTIQFGNVTEKNLFCRLCEMPFPRTAGYLHDHLKGAGHLICFEKMKKDEESNCDSLWDDRLQKCKYDKFFEYNGPNNNWFCKLCCVIVPKSKPGLKSHVDGKSHTKKFENLISSLMRVNDTEKVKEEQKSIGTCNKKETPSVPLASLKEEKKSKDKLSTSNKKETPVSSVPIASPKEEKKAKNKLSTSKNDNLKTTNPSDQITEVTKDFLKKALMKMSLDLLQKGSDTCESMLMFCCCVCSYFSCNKTRWLDHLQSSSHINKIPPMSTYKQSECTCNLTLFCNDPIYDYHVNSSDHQSVMDLMKRFREHMVKKNTSLDSVPASASNDAHSSDSDNDKTENVLDDSSESGVEEDTGKSEALDSKSAKSKLKKKKRADKFRKLKLKSKSKVDKEA